MGGDTNEHATINVQGAGIGRSQKSHPRLSRAATAAIFPALLGESSSPRGFVHQMCPSTKRTHRFVGRKQHLSICDTMGYAGKICQETVGSFSETNPPGTVFGGVRLPWQLLRGISSDSVWKTNPPGGGLEEGRTGELGGFGVK